jgi:hypothetical protein
MNDRVARRTTDLEPTPRRYLSKLGILTLTILTALTLVRAHAARRPTAPPAQWSL